MSTALPLVLCIDDERQVLDGLSRVLRHDFDLVLAVGGAAALTEMQSGKPFAVVLTDMRMPQINGVVVLTSARKLLPAATRVLLTGYADTAAAVAAVNEGQVFRFLTKPCSPAVMRGVLLQAVEQHRLVTAERDVLELTLRGSVQALIEMLALTHPAVFGRAQRARRLIGELAAMIGFRDRWQMEMAAMLSQVGAVTLPAEVVALYAAGVELHGPMAAQVAGLPGIALRLLGDIPRLDEIRAILSHVNHPYEATATSGEVMGENLPLGARMLRVVLDYDALRSQGFPSGEAVARLKAREGMYDQAVVSDLGTILGAEDSRQIREIRFQDVQLGMSFVDDVRGPDGTLLVARGQDVTQALLDRIEDFWAVLELPAPVRVTFDGPAVLPAAAA
ncbi:MAG: HD domain-containing phosphohydrolase [Gemmatimonadales bacterium]